KIIDDDQFAQAEPPLHIGNREMPGAVAERYFIAQDRACYSKHSLFRRWNTAQVVLRRLEKARIVGDRQLARIERVHAGLRNRKPCVSAADVSDQPHGVHPLRMIVSYRIFYFQARRLARW